MAGLVSHKTNKLSPGILNVTLMSIEVICPVGWTLSTTKPVAILHTDLKGIRIAGTTVSHSSDAASLGTVVSSDVLGHLTTARCCHRFTMCQPMAESTSTLISTDVITVTTLLVRCQFA